MIWPPGASVTAYWPVNLPCHLQPRLWLYDQRPLALTAAARAASSKLTTQSEIGAMANKLLPSGSTQSVTPNVVTLGGLVTVRITGFTLGTVGQGPKGTYDVAAAN